jgi:hypothetical protein
MGLFDNNGGFFGYEPTDADRQQALYQGLLGLGSELSASGAMTLTPGGNSHHMANAGNAFNQGMTGYLNHQKMGHQQKQQSQMQNIMAGLEMKKHQAAMAEAERKRAAQTNFRNTLPEDQRPMFDAAPGQYMQSAFSAMKPKSPWDSYKVVGDQVLGIDEETNKPTPVYSSPKPPDQPSNGLPEGTGMDAWAVRTLNELDTSHPVYAQAYNFLSAPRTSFDPVSGQQVSVRPNMSAFKAPTQAPNTVTAQQASGPPAPMVGGQVSQPSPLQPSAGDAGGVDITDVRAPKNITKIQGHVDQANASLDTFIGLIEKHGFEILPGVAKGELQAVHTDLLMQYKNLYEMGALQQPDKVILEELIPNPTKFASMLETGGLTGQGTDMVIAQLKQAKKMLTQRMAVALGGQDIQIKLPTTPMQGMQTKGADLPPGFELVED